MVLLVLITILRVVYQPIYNLWRPHIVFNHHVNHWWFTATGSHPASLAATLAWSATCGSSWKRPATKPEGSRCPIDSEAWSGWLVGGWALPLWKTWVRQLGWWHSQLNGKIKVMFQTTNQMRLTDIVSAISIMTWRSSLFLLLFLSCSVTLISLSYIVIVIVLVVVVLFVVVLIVLAVAVVAVAVMVV